MFSILASVYFLKRSFKEHSLIFTISKSLEEYNQAKINVLTDLAQPLNSNITILQQDLVPKIGVVIIGEATSRWHMQLYGYNRKINPLLSEIKEELFVFEDAISPHVMTIRSFEKDLALHSFETPQHNANFSVVQLANSAGFNTHWISNQEPVGFTESIPTIIGSAAKQTSFLATNSYNYSIYDEDVLPELAKALKRNGERQLVFLHLIGTHRLI
ncbi:sulfatase-like hydrolase/transferase [Bizionia saleffrena]|uniref:Sulfatase-like hydrolase/transferase n=1 Tax=Bizionia saleffrena TaxID=291189 RepID=A0A8H2QJ19_9FLAO|nr:sulfatase-like hydrolase/transferase [Bizionia saleffrena]TYB73122.1 sulfatase-like hydrolase/transferase [Bizionia saleffrena]